MVNEIPRSSPDYAGFSFVLAMLESIALKTYCQPKIYHTINFLSTRRDKSLLAGLNIIFRAISSVRRSGEVIRGQFAPRRR